MRYLHSLLLVVIAPYSTAAVAAAPPGALNKTVTVSFSVSIPARGADGSTLTGARHVSKTIYGSNLGRVFAETARTAGRNAQHVQKGPEGTASSFRFEGNRLVGVLKLGNGASQLVINFDNNFQSCSASILTGAPSGAPLTWTGLNGVKYTATRSASASSPSCSVMTGNGFAH